MARHLGKRAQHIGRIQHAHYPEAVERLEGGRPHQSAKIRAGVASQVCRRVLGHHTVEHHVMLISLGLRGGWQTNLQRHSPGKTQQAQQSAPLLTVRPQPMLHQRLPVRDSEGGLGARGLRRSRHRVFSHGYPTLVTGIIVGTAGPRPVPLRRHHGPSISKGLCSLHADDLEKEGRLHSHKIEGLLEQLGPLQAIPPHLRPQHGVQQRRGPPCLYRSCRLTLWPQLSQVSGHVVPAHSGASRHHSLAGPLLQQAALILGLDHLHQVGQGPAGYIVKFSKCRGDPTQRGERPRAFLRLLLCRHGQTRELRGCGEPRGQFRSTLSLCVLRRHFGEPSQRARSAPIRLIIHTTHSLPLRGGRGWG
mmetsp:Transcript_109559/g.251236  ORF Transcript_109559/g.251236 Transcript_109559/m.251236 type:complete len:362 (-) Transcript_109559:155-1240(-)